MLGESAFGVVLLYLSGTANRIQPEARTGMVHIART